MSQRLIAISDIHGYYNEFVELLLKVNYQKGVDRLFILGDIVDRGPESFKTLTLIRNLQLRYPDTVTVIKGNHDEEFLNIIKLLRVGNTLDNEGWDLYAGFTGDELQTLSVYNELLNDNDKDRLIEWLDARPYYAKYGNYIFVHAGVDAKVPLDKQSTQFLLWGKYSKENTFLHNKAYEDKIVVFGHICTKTIFKMRKEEVSNNIWYDMKYYDKICIDCGIWTGGKLGALIINPENETYEEMYV